ncbi:hypothetical protein ACOZE3_00900 [Streptomyces cinereoruber]|uniref:hypothetical protein n=1 Tax=Streptomyces cinereoruber TaxID=67260 RepID=UPI003BF46A6A
MRKGRRISSLFASSALVAGAIVGGSASPVSAHDYYQAIRAGCDWWDSHFKILESKVINNPAGAWMGNVYLVWNGPTGQNCVVTVQEAGHGIPAKLVAKLGIRSSGSGAITYRTDSGYYGHFAAVKEYTSGQCVNYRGEIAGSVAGRTEWGNCG